MNSRPGKEGRLQEDRLALPDTGDIGSGDVDDDLDLGEIHEGQDARDRGEAAHHRVDDVADLGVLGGDDAAEGRLHDGDVQGVRDQVQGGLGLLELGVGRVEGERHLLVLLFGHRVLLDQAVHPLLVLQGVVKAGLGDGHPGLGLLELEPGGFGVELGQDLALADAIALADDDAGDLAADLGSDARLLEGFQGPGVGDLRRDPLPDDPEGLDDCGLFELPAPPAASFFGGLQDTRAMTMTATARIVT